MSNRYDDEGVKTPPRTNIPKTTRALHDYADDCGCGQARCNGGWFVWNGVEYPCAVRERAPKTA